MDLVQGKAVWCTNALNRGFGIGKGFLVYQRLESWVWYRKRLSGVPTALNRGFVQGKAVWCTNRLESWSLYREGPSVPTALNRGFWAVETFLEYKTL